MQLKRSRYRREWEKHEFLANAQRRRISHKEINIDKKPIRMRTGKNPFALATRKLLHFINTWIAGRKVNDGWVREHGVDCLQCNYNIKGSNLFKHLFRAISIEYGSQRKIFFFYERNVNTFECDIKELDNIVERWGWSKVWSLCWGTRGKVQCQHDGWFYTAWCLVWRRDAVFIVMQIKGFFNLENTEGWPIWWLFVWLFGKESLLLNVRGNVLEV